MQTVDFAGLRFYGDEPDNSFAVTRLVGWYDAAPVRDVVQDRPTSDGAFGVDRFYRGARVITVEGEWVGTDIAEAYRARDALTSVQSDGLPGTFTVTDPLGVRSCYGVTLAKEPTVDDVLSAPFFEFSFDVVARDPRRYGPEVSSSTGLPTSGTGYAWPARWPALWGTPGDPGRATVENVGSVESWPVLEVTGELENGVELVQIETGAVLRLDRTIPYGSVVVLDGRRGRAYLDTPSNDITGFLTRREWWPVPAGQSRTVQFNALGASSGSPLLTVRVSPAY